MEGVWVGTRRDGDRPGGGRDGAAPGAASAAVAVAERGGSGSMREARFKDHFWVSGDMGEAG